MDAAAAFPALATTTIGQVVQATASPTVLVKVKKAIMVEQRAVESKKRAARRDASRQRTKEEKATITRAKDAKLLQDNSNAEAQAKQGAVQAIAMLKGRL
jgi:hypothetical protein